MKPVLNPKIVQIGLAMLGAVFVGVAHIQGPLTWQSVLAVIGAVITGSQVIPRIGDVAVSALPKDMQESVRPPKP